MRRNRQTFLLIRRDRRYHMDGEKVVNDLTMQWLWPNNKQQSTKHNTENQRPSKTNLTKNRRCSQMFLKGNQILFPICYNIEFIQKQLKDKMKNHLSSDLSKFFYFTLDVLIISITKWPTFEWVLLYHISQWTWYIDPDWGLQSTIYDRGEKFNCLNINFLNLSSTTSAVASYGDWYMHSWRRLS